MPQLIIKIKDKIAKPLNNCVICDNSDYTVKFIFDEEWEKEPLRIARFIWNKQYVDVQFTGDTCEVPVVSKTNNLAIGVYAGDLRTTTPAILTCYTSILSEDVVEHSVTPSEYEEIMKLLNAQATDIAALKAVDKRIWTNLDTINKTASAAKVKAEEGVAKADDALTATRTNTSNINSLRTDVNALKATDESIWTNLDTINKTASAAKFKAEEGVAKADDALARNIFTDEEKAKLASITNPIIIKGRVDTVNDLPTEAVIGWFYFVGLESASSYEEYCYSENGWEYIGLSQEGVDLSNYYTKKQVDTTVNELKAIDNSLGTRIDNVDSKASAAKIKAEEGVAKADNALTATRTNAANISTHETRLDSIDNTLSSHDTRITTAQQKANSVDEKVDSTNEVVGQLSTSLQSAYNKINAHANDIAINRTTLGTQCKNLHDTLSVNWYQPDKTSVASDGTVTTTITSDSRSFTYASSEHYITLEAGNYIITVNTLEFVSGSAALIRGCNSDNQSLFALSVSSAGLHKAAFSLSEKTTIGIMYKLYSQTCTIMIRDADILDDTYEPYSNSVNTRLTENKSNTAINKSTLGYQCKNLLDETGYLSSITSVSIGTFNISGNSITLTATGKDCYTKPHTSSDGGYRIPVEPDTDYILSWESDNTYAGLVYAFLNGDLRQQRLANNKDTKYLKFTTKSDTTFITIRLGVATSGNSITYSNIMLRYADILDDTYEPYQPSVREQIIGTYFPTTQEKRLANNTDLNTITEIGNYVCYTGSSAATMINCPTKAGGFRLIVTNLVVSSNDNSTIRYQWIISNNLNDVLCFRRRIDMSTDTFSNWYSFKSYQPGLQEQIPYSISVSGKSTSAAISYSGVPTLVCLTPNTADSTTGGLYMINSAGAVIKLIEKTGVVVATNTANNTFTITNNTSTVMDVCISRCWGR